MAFWSRWFGKRQTEPAPSGGARALAGGRVSTDTLFSSSSFLRFILPPPDAESRWRLADLDAHTLDRISPVKLLELLCDLSPDISRAVWDYLRLLNPGWKVTALRPGGEDDDVDPQAQAALDAFLATLKGWYGSVDVMIGRLFLGALCRGALFGELVLDPRGRLPVDFATPDPATARFEKRQDPLRGEVWQLGQWQADKGFVVLDRPTIAYIPVDPFPGKPYGRAPLAPSLFVTLFLLGLMHDLRRVVAQQGYPRIDLSILTEKLAATLPPSVASDPNAYKQWVNELIDEVKKVYANLEPDDAYVHTDVIAVNRPVGTVDAESLGAIDGLIEALERMSVRALKTMPFMMAISESTTETQANRQAEVFFAGVRGFQHLAESLIERLLTLGLTAQGIAAEVQWRFAELRAAEELRDEQVKQLRYQNAIRAYLYGWDSHEQASMAATGHAPDAEEPRALPSDVTLPGEGGETESEQGTGVGDEDERSQRNGYHAGPLPAGVQ